MNFDLHIGLKIEKAVSAFLHLASTFSAVPLVVVIRLPTYIKAVNCFRISSAHVILPGFAGGRILISLVLVFTRADECISTSSSTSLSSSNSLWRTSYLLTCNDELLLATWSLSLYVQHFRRVDLVLFKAKKSFIFASAPTKWCSDPTSTLRFTLKSFSEIFHVLLK